jgi:glycosyltransferase involved in cell wall biosynthesis
MRILKGFVRRANGVLSFFGVFTKVNQFEVISRSNGSKKLLVIGPGDVSIPPIGWGAVETIIGETLKLYVELGFEVHLLNSKSIFKWLKAKKQEYNVILLHVDNYAFRSRKYFPRIPIVCVTHYGMLLSPDSWSDSYRQTVRHLQLMDHVCCLNQQIYEVLRNYVDEEKLFISSNGSDFEPQHGRDTNGPLICVGKIESRKKQYELFKKFQYSEINITFVGAVEDERVKNLINTNPENRNFFPGEWSREKLAENLKNFSALLLLSEGEADALVLYEAQLAGLPVFCTQKSLGAQDPNLDWINVIEFNVSPSELKNKLTCITNSPEEIAEFARKNYQWMKRNQALVDKLSQCVR